MPPTPEQLIRLPEKKGFVLQRIKGSHHYFVHPESGKITSVPLHNRDLAVGTHHAILKQAGIDKDDLK